MYRFQRLYGVIALSCAASLPLAAAVSPVIGFMTATGTVELDAAPVARHGTLLRDLPSKPIGPGRSLKSPRK